MVTYSLDDLLRITEGLNFWSHTSLLTCIQRFGRLHHMRWNRIWLLGGGNYLTKNINDIAFDGRDGDGTGLCIELWQDQLGTVEYLMG